MRASSADPVRFVPGISVALDGEPIGYLSGAFAKGSVPAGFLDALGKVEAKARHSLTNGFHVCSYCFPGGIQELSAKIRSGELPENAFKEFASSGDYHFEGYQWPDMLGHYVRTHEYLPPKAFVDAILKGARSA
jgi:hypothetical protein